MRTASPGSDETDRARWDQQASDEDRAVGNDRQRGVVGRCGFADLAAYGNDPAADRRADLEPAPRAQLNLGALDRGQPRLDVREAIGVVDRQLCELRDNRRAFAGEATGGLACALQLFPQLQRLFALREPVDRRKRAAFVQRLYCVELPVAQIRLFDLHVHQAGVCSDLHVDGGQLRAQAGAVRREALRFALA